MFSVKDVCGFKNTNENIDAMRELQGPRTLRPAAMRCVSSELCDAGTLEAAVVRCESSGLCDAKALGLTRVRCDCSELCDARTLRTERDAMHGSWNRELWTLNFENHSGAIPEL